jgi:hypothetical protein
MADKATLATATATQTAPVATAAPVDIYSGPFTIKVLDLHTEDRFEYSAPNMNDAINLYKRVVAAARDVEPRPFVYLDEAQWIALIKFSGGLVRQVWIAEAESGKVRGHNAGMRRREAAAQNPVALPPSITPVAKPVAAQPAVVASSTPEPVASETATDDIPF